MYEKQFYLEVRHSNNILSKAVVLKVLKWNKEICKLTD